jgi:streptogramin lyase
MAANLEAIVAELKRVAPRLRDYEPSDESWQQVRLPTSFRRRLAPPEALNVVDECVNSASRSNATAWAPF